MNKFFVHEIKQTGETINKGIVVAETLDAALQGYHAYLGAYAYGHEENTVFVSCMITDKNGVIMSEIWTAGK